MLTNIEGSSYRPVGSLMAVAPDGTRAGSLSSGCAEEALGALALEALSEGAPRTVRLGEGSPYRDIALPCGAGIDVLLVPSPDQVLLRKAAVLAASREGFSLGVSLDGGLSIGPLQRAGWRGARFEAPVVPPLRLLVIGKGEETEAFCRLAVGGGYEVLVYSPDANLLRTLKESGAAGAEHLTVPQRLPTLKADAQTAAALFFHDHEWEPPALHALLGGAAFWIGAQGSSRAALARADALRHLGTGESELSRLRSGIGLIASARDPQTLAVSVLADIVKAYKERWFDPYQEASSPLRAVS